MTQPAAGSSLSMKGRTALITGASRGIGRAIALRFARDGANVVLASKSTVPHPKLKGTLQEVAAEVEQAGGKAVVSGCDVREEADVQRAVDAGVSAFGGIDVVVNNAGAINLSRIDELPMKRFDLMLGINARAVFMVTKLALPHLRASAKAGRAPHVVNLSPPMSMNPKWLKGQVGYTLTKYGMSFLSKALAEDLREDGIAVNSLWPRTIIATAAIDMLMGDGVTAARTPEIMADAAHAIVTTTNLGLTGEWLLDEDFLRTRGVTDFKPYACSDQEPLPDFYVD
jgi:citronellol/citronellal dehydrogenase